jgi:hypothetical protein
VVNGIDISNHPNGLRSFGLNNVDLSIIIVNYRSWQALEQCLDSFAEFTPKLNHEIIVVDNDSQDKKLKPFSQKYPHVTFIKNSGNNGFSNGCNLGAYNANAEFLLFLNPDTVLTSNSTIDSMFEFANKNSSVGITSCRRINPKGNPEREMAFANPWLIISWIRAIYKLTNNIKIEKKFPNKDDIWYPDWVAGSVVLIKAKLFYKVDRWNQESFWMYYEDVDLCRKVRYQNNNIALLRNVELQHSHGGSSRRDSRTMSITKSEVVTSSHVYIQLHTTGLNRFALHSVIIVDTLLSQAISVVFTSLVFWKIPFKANALVLFRTLKYYITAPTAGTWKSKRLNLNE